MKDLEKIKEHITAIIRKEERKTQSEMEESVVNFFPNEICFRFFA